MIPTIPANSSQINWKAILSYFILATGMSLIFRLYQPSWLDMLKLPDGYGLNLMVGSGPFLAAVITQRLFRKNTDKLPLYGNDLVRSLIFMLAPCIVLIVIGIKSKEQLNEHIYAVQLSFFWLLYIFGEEYGWRGYLQQSIKANDYIKALIVGLQWYIWHLSFLLETTNPERELVFLTVLIIGSFIAIKVTNRTGSLLTSVGLHFSFSVMTNIPTSYFYQYAIFAMLITWALLLWKWQTGDEKLKLTR